MSDYLERLKEALLTEYSDQWAFIYNEETSRDMGWRSINENWSTILIALENFDLGEDVSSAFDRKHFETVLEEAYYRKLYMIAEPHRRRMANESMRYNIEHVLFALKTAKAKLVLIDKGV